MKRQVTAAMAVCLSASMAFSSLAAVKLETPTGVQWSDEHEALPQWNAVDGAAGQYQVEAYLDGERFYRSTHRFSTTNLRDTYEARGFICNVEDSGIYQFRVMALGDDINTTDSDWSPMSESWSFTKPSLQFGKPSNLRWEGTTLMWDEPEIPAEYEQYLNGYEVTVYGDGEFIIGHNSIDPGYDNAEWMEEDDVSQWTFSVRAISNTPSVIFHGETVEGDSAYDAGEENASISDTIDGILSSEDPEILENAPDKLKENTDKLQVAMQTDSQVLDQIRELEERYAEQKNLSLAENQVADEVADLDFDGSAVEMVGALLNAEDDHAEVALTITRPDREEVIDATAYKNAIQLDFHLNGVPSGPLKVPVRMTVPIPESINPEFFRVLHYLKDGTVEEFGPLNMEIDADNRTASFTITSFSTFVLAEEGIDYVQLATPSNASEFRKLAESLPAAEELDLLSDDDYEAAGIGAAKLGDSLRNSDVDADDVELEMLEKLDGLFAHYFPVEITYGDEETGLDVMGLSLLGYAYAGEDAEEVVFTADQFQVASDSNAATKVRFRLSATVLTESGDEIEADGRLKSPLLVYMDAPDGYDEIHHENDYLHKPNETREKLLYEDGMFQFYVVKKLGKFTIQGPKAGIEDPDNDADDDKPSASRSSKPRAGVVKEPKSPEGGSWTLVNGAYSYLYSDGTKAANCWLKINGLWYYFNMDGTMVTGWLKDGGNYFYLNPASGALNGAMMTGWQEIDGRWYYFSEEGNGFTGMMYADTTTPDGYQVNGNGVWNPES